MPDRKPALGKGLSALIPDVPDPAPSLRSSIDVDVDLLEPNDYQPRGPMHDERVPLRAFRSSPVSDGGVPHSARV